MTGWQDAVRELRGYRYLSTAKRLFDTKPLQCSLYVTDQCNLDCAYCTEYDNSKPHPALEDITRWLTKIRDLGTVRVALVGGEPLMHPDIVEIVRRTRRLGIAVSLTTNGFLLSKELLDDLEGAGLEVMQISVDRMTPSAITRKSFKTILPKLELFRGSRINLHVTGVLCADTLPESRAVLETGLSRGLPTEVRVVHADPDQQFRVDPGARRELEAFIEWMKDAKESGVKIHTTDAILDYQLALVRGQPFEWSCTAGFKIFFVSAQGKFWICSMRPTEKHILDVTPSDLVANNRPKPCQNGCGIYCSVSTSLFYQRPFVQVGREASARIRRALRRPSASSAARDLVSGD